MLAMTDYYGRHYRAYFEATVNLNPEPFLGAFARRLSAGDRVLDVGCGSGRDMHWLRGKGMRVTGFEQSAGLAELARQGTGCHVIEGDFTTFDFSALAVEAILLCGALVHVPHRRLAAVMAGILRALDPEGRRRLVYLSLKEGDGTAVDRRGRRVYFWRDAAIRRLLNDMGLRLLEFQRSPSADGRGAVWLGYGLHCPARGCAP